MPPAFKTVKNADRLLGFGDWGLAYLGTVVSVLGPAALCGLIGVLPILPAAVREGALAIAAVLLMAPFLTMWLVPVGMLMGAWALRFGWAGWGTALLASFVPPAVMFVPAILSSEFGIVLVYGFIGAPVFAWHAFALWWIARWRTPEAFAPRTPD